MAELRHVASAEDGGRYHSGYARRTCRRSRRLAKAADKRADIWAFGVVLYEMLTAQPLFTGETTLEILGARD